MDRPKRQARHPRLSVRSWKAELQENGGVCVSQLEIVGVWSAAVRIVRKLDPVRHATLLCSTGTPQSGNAC